MKSEEEYLQEMFDLNNALMRAIDADPVIGPIFGKLEKEFYTQLPYYGFLTLEDAKAAFACLIKDVYDPDKEKRKNMAAELRKILAEREKALGPLFQWENKPEITKGNIPEQDSLDEKEIDDELERE